MAFPDRDQLKAQLDKWRHFRTEENLQAIDKELVKEILTTSKNGKLSDFQSIHSQIIKFGEEENEAEMVDFAIHVAANQEKYRHGSRHRAYIVLFAAAEERPNPAVWTLLLDEVGYGSPPTKPGELNIGYAGSTASSLIMQGMPGAHEVVQIFINRGFRPQFYHMEQAAVRGSPESLLVLLSDILPRFPTGHFHDQYILQDTVSRGKLENAKILIEKAVVDVNDVPTWRQAPEWYGDLPRPSPALQNAVHSSDMIKMLMEHGARINIRNSNVITPIEFARIYKCYEAEKLMLELAPPEDIPMSYRTMSSEAEK